MKPNLDLSMESLIKACKGNVKALPSFMVHDNAAWPWVGSVKLDSKNRIHMRRSTFLRTVSEDLPVRAGIWHGIDVQEFHLELEAHHLGGGVDQQKEVGHKQSRALVMADKHGRPLGDIDHGDAAGYGLLGMGEFAALGGYDKLPPGQNMADGAFDMFN